MIIVHYEVYVLDPRGWVLHARFPRQERDLAIGEAKELESTCSLRVKVLRETYYTESNKFDEAEVYLSVGAPSSAAKADGKAGGKRSASKQSWMDEAESSGSLAGNGGSGRHYRRKPGRQFSASASNVLGRMVIITGLGLGTALGAIRLMPEIVVMLYTYGFRITPDSYGQLLFGVFVLVFLMVSVPLSLRYLPHQTEITLRRPGFGWGGSRQITGNAEVKRSLNKLAERAAAEERRPEPQPEPEEPAAEEVLPDILPGLDEELPDIRPDGDPAAPAARPSQASELGIHSMRFLGAALTAMRGVAPTLDKYNKFALNLYMAGAVDGLASAKGLDEAGERAILQQALETLGTGPEMASRFHDKMGDYLAEPRYLQIIQSGRTAMDSWLSGDEANAHAGLAAAVQQWNKPAEKKASIVTVMFTDMVGSTDITQSRGDAAAQEIVRRHNTIVRTALAQFAGKEIKHTGDGIMASFTSAASAVEAAATIQRQVAAHNSRFPDQELHLRIGLNSGEPIQEENDLFGTTVQLAARVCAATDTDKILCTAVVKDLSFGKGASFAPAGEHDLKGFRDRIALWEALW